MQCFSFNENKIKYNKYFSYFAVTPKWRSEDLISFKFSFSFRKNKNIKLRLIKNQSKK